MDDVIWLKQKALYQTSVYCHMSDGPNFPLLFCISNTETFTQIMHD
jgi:hypothetical protein